MSLRARFMSDEKLQAEALDLLAELIRRDLLTASVNITDPSCVVSCAILDAFPTGSRDASQAEILSSYMTGTLPKKKGGPGITLSINQAFRLSVQKEAEVRAALEGVNGT
ncbi:hypothetical protein ABIE88_003423 [Bradyrhizobium diazoefficiens]|uniref:hypothetical protein n=1 Tax=Bradyrhizobium diazoefficiens TaxID=1355477 RepID=UPI0035174050